MKNQKLKKKKKEKKKDTYLIIEIKNNIPKETTGKNTTNLKGTYQF